MKNSCGTGRATGSQAKPIVAQICLAMPVIRITVCFEGGRYAPPARESAEEPRQPGQITGFMQPEKIFFWPVYHLGSRFFWFFPGMMR
jgi:hypothetical protein